jgi:hypothetical protein
MGSSLLRVLRPLADLGWLHRGRHGWMTLLVLADAIKGPLGEVRGRVAGGHLGDEQK